MSAAPTSNIHLSNAHENEQIWATMIDYKARIPIKWRTVSLYSIYKHKLALLYTMTMIY